VSELKRLVVDYRDSELVIRCLYRTEVSAGPNTKGRLREVSGLVRTGLQDALEALEGRAECVGTSGFTTREDVLLVTTSSDALETVGQVKEA
jgi:hypothetical protein